jgi:thymidine phosphorylase
MNQPLGNAVGNALEVREAIETLRGGGPADFREHCLHVAAHMLLLAGSGRNLREARRRAETALREGAALGKFRSLVEAQGGDVGQVDNPERLPSASHVETVLSRRRGYLRAVDARAIGLAAVGLGAGRSKKGDPIDPAVGVVVHRKVGDRVDRGDALFTIHASDPTRLSAARAEVLQAHRFSAKPVRPLPLFHGVVRSG